MPEQATTVSFLQDRTGYNDFCIYKKKIWQKEK